MTLTYRNQSIDLQSKSIDWFLYERGFVVKGLRGLYFLSIRENAYLNNSN